MRQRIKRQIYHDALSERHAEHVPRRVTAGTRQQRGAWTDAIILGIYIAIRRKGKERRKS